MQTTINTQKSALIEGAQIVLDTFSNPIAFFDFMTDVLGWINTYEVKHQVQETKSVHYTAVELLREIGFRWMEAPKGQELSAIANGIFAITDTCDHENIESMNSTISVAFHDFITSLSATWEAYSTDSKKIFSLIKIGEAMENFEHETNLKAG